MKKAILIAIIISLFVTPTVLAVDTGKPLIETNVEYGNVYSIVEGTMPWLSAPNVPETLNSDDIEVMESYIDGYITYNGIKTTNRRPPGGGAKQSYAYYYWKESNPSSNLIPPQISFEQFVNRADLDNDGGVTSNDISILQQYLNGEIDTFPVCSHIATADEGITDLIGFAFLQLSSNPFNTIIELVIIFVINLLLTIVVLSLIFNLLRIKTRLSPNKKMYKKGGVVLEEVSKTVKHIGIIKALSVALIGSIVVFMVETLFLSTITSGIIGMAITVSLFLVTFAVMGIYILGIKIKDATEFGISMTLLNILIWIGLVYL